MVDLEFTAKMKKGLFFTPNWQGGRNNVYSFTSEKGMVQIKLYIGKLVANDFGRSPLLWGAYTGEFMRVEIVKIYNFNSVFLMGIKY